MCTHTHTHTLTHTHSHTHVHTCTFLCVHTHTHTHPYMYTHTCAHTHTHRRGKSAVNTALTSATPQMKYAICCVRGINPINSLCFNFSRGTLNSLAKQATDGALTQSADL